jgi:hypothetical protein
MSEVCELSVGVYFVSEVKIAQPPTIISGQIVTETNAALFLKVRHPRCVFKSDVRYMYTSNTTMSSMLSISVY